jgi:hypothetical protein
VDGTRKNNGLADTKRLLISSGVSPLSSTTISISYEINRNAVIRIMGNAEAWQMLTFGILVIPYAMHAVPPTRQLMNPHAFRLATVA